MRERENPITFHKSGTKQPVRTVSTGHGERGLSSGLSHLETFLNSFITLKMTVISSH